MCIEQRKGDYVLKRIITLSLLIATTIPVLAQAQKSAEGEKVIQAVVPQCYEATMQRSAYSAKLPFGFTAEQITLESEDPYCRFDGALVKTNDGRWYLGTPWPLGPGKGAAADKLKLFAWERMKESFLAESAGNDGSLEKIIVRHVTSAGRVKMEGYVDQGGMIFMIGDVASTAAEMVKKRNDRLAPILAKAPTKGPTDAPIRIIEFSDFQCPSCKHAHEFLPGLLAKYEGKVRYTRVDLPLVGSHPWAFAAAVIGRSIYRQSPEVFWQWKDAVYANQADLNPFAIDQFGRNFAEDHGLDMKKYDADVASDEIRNEILDGAGVAYTIHVGATPTFLVNDRFVASGLGGKNLTRYLAELAAK